MEIASTASTSTATRYRASLEGLAESRHDPITGRWTIFAPHRAGRPDDFRGHQPVVAPAMLDCPFCRGNESETPEPVWVGRVAEQNGDADWSVRVVPNKFPAVAPVAMPEVGGPVTRGSLFQSRPIAGGHEVIIESPHHAQSLTQLSLDEVELVFAAYQDRIRHWRSVSGIRYISVFKNVGRDAGASLQHSHGQLIATDALPSEVGQICERMERYRAMSGCCLHCELIRAELKENRRVIAQNDTTVAFCPFASAMPYLVQITTQAHHDRYEDLSPELIREVARMTRRVLGWLEQMEPGVAYNYLLHTLPPRSHRDGDAHHWSLEIFPRITQIAGFEFGSHCMINPVLPEVAAERYRHYALAEDPRRTLRRQPSRL